MSERIGILHPGQMGASVGAAARAAGATVRWASEGRSDATRRRAGEAGLLDVGRVEALVRESEVLLSVCPPASALRVAEIVRDRGFGGLYVDANAIAPATARRVATIVEAGGARFVDGGIVGPPATRPGTTRLYLSGDEAERVARLFESTALAPVTVDGGPGAASALKACYAAWTKGSAALLLAIRSLAVREGVEAGLLDEWGLSQPDLEQRSERVARSNAGKAWRFQGEMLEIADGFEAAGLPGGFHRGAAEIYERLARFKDRPPPSLDEAVAAVLGEARAPVASEGTAAAATDPSVDTGRAGA